MLTSQDLFSIGIPSVKDVNYLSTNKISQEEKHKMRAVQIIGTYIRVAALDNKQETEVKLDLQSTEEMADIKQALEKIGYKIKIEIITTPLVPNKAIYILYIKWN